MERRYVTLMSERNTWFMLNFKNFLLLKRPTVRWNCTELTGISYEKRKKNKKKKKKKKKGLNGNNKSRLSSVTRLTFKDFISEW